MGTGQLLHRAVVAQDSRPHSSSLLCCLYCRPHFPVCSVSEPGKNRGVSSPPAGSHLQQEHSDKAIELKLASAEQQATTAIEWQINTVKHRVEEI